MRQVALAFVAHPDDAEMACTGTLMQLAERGWSIHIATLTGGDLGSVTERPAEAVRTRKAEASRAAELIGASYHCLDEPDGRAVYSREALGKAYNLFRRVSPSLVITHPPIDYHRDHEITHQIGRAASFAYAAPHAGDEPVASILHLGGSGGYGDRHAARTDGGCRHIRPDRAAQANAGLPCQPGGVDSHAPSCEFRGRHARAQ